MFKRLITLIKLGRKLAKSDELTIISKFNKPPLLVTVIFKLLSFSFTKKDVSFDNLSEGEKLSNSLASMGTTFIKLGQFLATRPDIIGDALSKELENLQDKLPPFSQSKEKESNLNITVTNKGGLLNFDTIVKASDLASFLPSLNKVINLLNIIFSNQNE